MNQLTLTSTGQRPLKPLIEAALDNELRLLEAAIQRTEKRLRQFEAANGISSAEFSGATKTMSCPKVSIMPNGLVNIAS